MVSSDLPRGVRNLGTRRVVVDGTVVVSDTSTKTPYQFDEVRKNGLFRTEDGDRVTRVVTDLRRRFVSRHNGVLRVPTTRHDEEGVNDENRYVLSGRTHLGFVPSSEVRDL